MVSGPRPRIETEGEGERPFEPPPALRSAAAPASSPDAPIPAARPTPSPPAVPPVSVPPLPEDADPHGASARPAEPGLPWPAPRIEAEAAPAARLTPLELPPLREPRQPWSMPALTLTGCVVLGLGLAALQAGNFVADQFARSPPLGWITLAVTLGGFGLIGTGLLRELRGLLGVRAVDRLRQDLAGPDPLARQRAARAWLRSLPDGPALLPAIDAVNDPDAILALLRAGPETTLRARADALGRTAALQVVAGMAAAPAPALVVLLVSWRGLRLLRQVATAYGLRPGVLGTLGLLRRTALAAGATAVTEVAVNAATHGLLSSPLLQHLAGEMAGGAVAARRMVVLARAAAVACSPVPRE